MDKLKLLGESFVSVATKGNLTAAAKAEGRPRHHGAAPGCAGGAPGRELMVRTTRRINLTHEGSCFLKTTSACSPMHQQCTEASVSAGA